ncbi:MAG TPA: hypothetical protein VMT18_00335 [Planctomycetota bacterium]|nr:hypothetical protein [Planctomycetota bacterium]
MAIPKKNLLEAFQASAQAEKAKVQPPAEASGAKAGGPFAPSPTTEPPPPVVRSAPRPESALRRPDALQRLIALQVVITIAAFFLGRASVGGVEARTPDEGVATAALAPNESSAQLAAKPPTKPAGEVAAVTSSEAGTAAERALLDPNNRYTVKLAEYRKDRDESVALETLRWLQSQGLPAVARYEGTRLFLLVGAGPEQVGLDALRDRLKTMNGPPPLNKPAEFHDAYISSIDRLITR